MNLVINDARNFIKETEKKYDMILYSLLDSHANLSSKGGVRLDSYVYTVDLFLRLTKNLKMTELYF